MNTLQIIKHGKKTWPCRVYKKETSGYGNLLKANRSKKKVCKKVCKTVLASPGERGGGINGQKKATAC